MLIRPFFFFLKNFDITRSQRRPLLHANAPPPPTQKEESCPPCQWPPFRILAWAIGKGGGMV